MAFHLLDPLLQDISFVAHDHPAGAFVHDPSFGRLSLPLTLPGTIGNPLIVDPYLMLSYPFMFSGLSFGTPQSYLSGIVPGSKNVFLLQRPLQDQSINPVTGPACAFDLLDTINECKRTKLDVNTNTEPSKVLHVRNIAPRAQEYDLTLLAVPFGKIKSMVYAKKTNQALIEMREPTEATRLLDYYTHYPPIFNGKTMIIQYSKHHALELKLQNSSIDVSVDAANKMVEDYRQRVRELKGERRILRVVIENFKNYNINHLVILKVFQRFGKVMRLIIFTKNMQCQCLIEMSSSVSAHAALLNLNGQEMFIDSCRLRVEFSKNCDSLQVQRQNDKCRDYIMSPLLDEERIFLENLSSCLQQPLPFQQNLSFIQSPLTDDLPGYSNIYFPFMPQAFGGSLHPQPVAVPEGPPLAQEGAITTLKTDPFLKPANSPAADDLTTILVTNINPEKVSPDCLFTLFGVYGDVVRVTIASPGSGAAFVQMMNSQQAATACRHLSGAPLYGRNLLAAIVTSKDILSQAILNSDLNTLSQTKDFSNTPLHRFKKPNSKNHFNIYPPSAILHLSNIPQSMLEEDLKHLFKKNGYDFLSLKIFQISGKEKKMALVKMASLEQSVSALIGLHNCKLSDSSHLRVSFSKPLF